MADPRVHAFAPGRVNLIGEHTDYNRGLCLPFAIDQGVRVTARPATGGLVRVRALDLGEVDRFRLDDPQPVGGWRAFARGTVAELRRTGRELRPVDIEISGTLPRNAGLASSAALGVALALALLAHGGEPEPDLREVARLCSRVENDWVGAQTGLLDQLAALLGRPGHALRLDMRDLSARPVPLRLEGWRLAVIDSEVRRAHARSGYNERRRECSEACRLLGVASLREADADAAAALPDPLDRRVRHVLDENRRVDETVAALAAGDLARVGRLLDDSHASLRDLFEVSLPEIDRIVDEVRSAGAAGARLTGGGFGGSVLALLPPGGHAPRGARVVAPCAGASVAVDR